MLPRGAFFVFVSLQPCQAALGATVTALPPALCVFVPEGLRLVSGDNRVAAPAAMP